MDPMSLAVAAINLALPYLRGFLEEANKGAGTSAGKSIWGWIKGKLTSAVGQEVTTDLEKEPEDGDSRKLAEAALSKFLRSNPEAAAELESMVGNAGTSSVTMISKTKGDGNTTIQIAGQGNTVSPPKGQA
jgi:hypothetical protein